MSNGMQYNQPPLSDSLADIANSLLKKPVLIWIDAELNALSNRDKLSLQYFQKLQRFSQILNEYEYTENTTKTLKVFTIFSPQIDFHYPKFALKKLASLF